MTETSTPFGAAARKASAIARVPFSPRGFAATPVSFRDADFTFDFHDLGLSLATGLRETHGRRGVGVPDRLLAAVGADRYRLFARLRFNQ